MIYRNLIPALLLLLAGMQSVQAMQLTDPRSAAVYIQKQRPLISGCLQQALHSRNLERIWNSQPCQQLMLQDQQLVTAWSLLLPNGSSTGIAAVPYELRKPTVEAYSEYKRLAERIAELSR